MSKIGKFILWALVCFVLLTIGLFIIAWSKNLSVSQSSSSYRTGGISYGMAEDSAQYTGLGASSNVVVDTVRTLSKGVMAPSTASQELGVGGSASSPAGQVDRLIIKNGQLSLVVKDVKDSIKAVSEYATKQGGFVVSSNVYKNGLIPYGTIVVRVPAAKFDAGIIEVKALGEVVSESANGQDVTEEYVDLDAQLRNLRATEAQFLTIMAKAVKIEDILNVQRELTNVRGNIERLQGRMKYLKQSADLSTITVNFATDPAVLPSYDNSTQWKPWAEVKAAARALLEAGKKLVNLLIWLVIFVPIWAIIAVVVWVAYKIYGRIKNDRHDINNLR